MKRTPLKSYTSLKRHTPLRSNKRINVKGHSDAASIKDEIQNVVREIALIRDQGCVFRNYPGHVCSGYAQDGHLILQFDHLVSRSHAATYADPRLGVIVCKGIHAWKSLGSNANKQEYDEMVRTLLPADRVALWDRCEQERRSQRGNRGVAYNWALALAAVRQELREMQPGPDDIRYEPV